MKKIKEFIKQNYILITIIGAVVFIILASIIITCLINKFSSKVEVKNDTANMYQILGGVKYGFEADVVLHDKAYYLISPKDYNLSGWYPIYIDDNSWVINSNDSIMVSYIQNFAMFKIPKYSKIAKESSSYKINVNGNNYITNNYFIYDPTGHYYIFLDDITLKFNGKIINLSPMSSVSASIAGITYYNAETGEMFNYNDKVENAEIIFDTFSINLINNIITHKDNLISVNSNLNGLRVFKED